MIMLLMKRETPATVGSSLPIYKAFQLPSVKLRSGQAIITFHYAKYLSLDQLNCANFQDD